MIGNMIGRPISTDTITNEVEKLSYARILVEVVLESYNGTIYKHKVGFEWVPWHCESCNSFGHSTHFCNLRNLPNQQETSQRGSMHRQPKSFKVVLEGPPGTDVKAF